MRQVPPASEDIPSRVFPNVTLINSRSVGSVHERAESSMRSGDNNGFPLETSLPEASPPSASAPQSTGGLLHPSTSDHHVVVQGPPALRHITQQALQHLPASTVISSTVFAPQENMSSEGSCLHISAMTWTRDSHELFDYEARHVHKKSYYVSRPAKVFRLMSRVQVIPDGQALPDQVTDYLLSVRQREGRYVVYPPEKNLQGPQGTIPINMFPKRVWLIVRELPRGHHQLQESDIIKLGRFKLRVKQLVKAGPVPPELRFDDSETPHSTVTAEEAVTMQCRICLLDGGTDEDPLVCPCQCKGSIKFVHLDCLRHWINGRLSLTEDNQAKSFFFKQLQCELCKTAFPSAVVLNGERVPIVKVPKIEAPFIILENLGGVHRGLHVVSMEEKKELKLGRGHESDVRIADVSISRYHATIRFADGEFILEDHNSKFGTLVSLRKMQPVDTSHPLSLQVGRTVLHFTLRRPPSDFDGSAGVADDPVASTPETDQEDEGPPSHTGSSDNPATGGAGNGGASSDQGVAQGPAPQAPASAGSSPPASSIQREGSYAAGTSASFRNQLSLLSGRHCGSASEEGGYVVHSISRTVPIIERDATVPRARRATAEATKNEQDPEDSRCQAPPASSEEGEVGAFLCVDATQAETGIPSRLSRYVDSGVLAASARACRLNERLKSKGLPVTLPLTMEENRGLETSRGPLWENTCVSPREILGSSGSLRAANVAKEPALSTRFFSNCGERALTSQLSSSLALARSPRAARVPFSELVGNRSAPEAVDTTVLESSSRVLWATNEGIDARCVWNELSNIIATAPQDAVQTAVPAFASSFAAGSR